MKEKKPQPDCVRCGGSGRVKIVQEKQLGLEENAGGIHPADRGGVRRGAPGVAIGWNLVGEHRGQLCRRWQWRRREFLDRVVGYFENGH